MRLTKEFIHHVVNDAQFLGTAFPADCLVSTDSQSGVLYIPEKGFTAEQYEIAQKHGVAALMCSTADVLPKMHTEPAMAIVVVPDVDDALYRLAHAWRAHISIPVIGITGSFGKTSTVQLLANVLKQHKLSVHYTNGHVRTPRALWASLLNVRSQHQVAVFEVGVTQRGTMKQFTHVLRPTTVAITGVGHAHLQGLGSIEDAAQEMKHIFSCLDEAGVGVVHGDQPLLAQAGYLHPVVKFGSKTTNQVQARKVRVYEHATEFVLKLYGQKYKVVVDGSHEGHVHNALAATALAHLLEVPVETIIQGLRIPPQVDACFQFLPARSTGATIINDTASISPESTRAGLHAFSELKSVNKKVLILSDMPSLGVTAPFWHRQIGRYIKKIGDIDQIILVGSLVSWVQQTLPASIEVTHVKDWQEAVALVKELDKGSCVLVKGDPTHQFDKLVQTLSA